MVSLSIQCKSQAIDCSNPQVEALKNAPAAELLLQNVMQRLIYCTVAILLFSASPAFAQSEKKLGRKLALAINQAEVNQAMKIVEQIASLGTAKAMDAIANYGVGHDRVIDKKIGSVLVSIDEEDAVKQFCKLTNKHGNYEVRVLFSFVCARRSDRDSLEALLLNIRDRHASVVLAAVEGCVKRGDLGAMDHLIAALARLEKAQSEGLIRQEMLKALNQFTGEGFGTAENWKKFWKPRKGKFKRPVAGQNKGLTGRRVKAPKFFGIEIPIDHVVFLLDISGSMAKIDPGVGEAGSSTAGAGESRMRMRRVQRELIQVLEKLDRNVSFNIVTFNHKVEMFQPKLLKASQSNKNRAISFVRGLKHEGETRTDLALEAGFDFQTAKVIYLLSDGCPRLNDTPMETEPILKMVKEINRFRRVRLNTIGFKQAGKSLRKFMRNMARQNNGVYREI